ncbi:MAG: hypothetical protein KF734_02150 [Saprospiraceae bacterium]|nr:hypothetical protein [Saprospiraceae bacterium]
MANETKSAHIGGFYTILAALIGLLGVWYAWHLSQKKEEGDEYSELRQVTLDPQNDVVGIWKTTFFDTISNDIWLNHRTLYLKSNQTGLSETKIFLSSKDISCTILAPFTWKHSISDLHLSYTDTKCSCTSELMTKTALRGFEEGMNGKLNKTTTKELFAISYPDKTMAISIFKDQMNKDIVCQYQRLK